MDLELLMRPESETANPDISVGVPKPFVMPPRPAEDGSDPSSAHYKARVAMVEVLRKIRLEAAPYTDGLTTELAKTFLRQEFAWEELAKVSACFESDVTFEIARAYAELEPIANGSNPEPTPPPPVFISLFKRYRCRQSNPQAG